MILFNRGQPKWNPKFSERHKWRSSAGAEASGRCVGWISLSEDRVMLLSPALRRLNHHEINCTTSNLIRGFCYGHQRLVFLSDPGQTMPPLVYADLLGEQIGNDSIGN